MLKTPWPFVTENRAYLVQPEHEMSKKTSWQVMAASCKSTCTPRSMWIEWYGTSDHGRRLWNMSKCVFRTSQLAWETLFCVFGHWRWQTWRGHEWLYPDVSNGAIFKRDITYGSWRNLLTCQMVEWGVCPLYKVGIGVCWVCNIKARSTD